MNWKSTDLSTIILHHLDKTGLYYCWRAGYLGDEFKKKKIYVSFLPDFAVVFRSVVYYLCNNEDILIHFKSLYGVMDSLLEYILECSVDVQSLIIISYSYGE